MGSSHRELIEDKIIEHDPPQILAAAAPQMPLTISAGQTFIVKLDDAVSQPELPAPEELKADPALASTMTARLFAYTWKQPTTYTSLADLIRDLNALPCRMVRRIRSSRRSGHLAT